ncbi:MAG: ABC transporter ATP-binding protein [Thermoproteota archaeon]
MPRVVLKGISKKFGKITALDNIDLSFEDGEYTCVLGPTGSGKTTLLKVIAGLVMPDSGDVYIDEKRITGIPPEMRNAVYMHQQYALFPNMTVSQNTSFGLVNKDLSKEIIDRRVSEALEMVRLKEWANAYPRELSGGMQQRVALARCLATGTKLLLLDEPLGALDARLRLEVRGELSRIAEELNLTVIHVTHDQSEAISLADRLILMRDGKVVQMGAPSDLYFKPNTIFAAYFLGESVFFECVVKEVEGDLVSLELRNGMIIEAFSKDSFKQGELAVAAVRCEDIVVGEGPLMGTLRERSFLGSFSKLFFELPDGLEISVNIPIAYYIKKDFRIGMAFHLMIPRERVYLFKYPDMGLAKEIEAV